MNIDIEKKHLRYALVFPVFFIAVLWIILAAEKFAGSDWYSDLGVLPRNMEGLLGIITSPLIHANVAHLASNSVPLLILGWCLFYFYRDLGYGVFPVLWLFSGIFTWVLGRDSYHIGASGLVYSLNFFLFFSGIFRRYVPLMAISMLVIFLYGSTMWGMFPVAEYVDPTISWEGHLAGAISGFLCAVIFRKQGPQRPVHHHEEFEEEEENPDEEVTENDEAEHNGTNEHFEKHHNINS